MSGPAWQWELEAAGPLAHSQPADGPLAHSQPAGTIAGAQLTFSFLFCPGPQLRGHP